MRAFLGFLEKIIKEQNSMGTSDRIWEEGLLVSFFNQQYQQ